MTLTNTGDRARNIRITGHLSNPLGQFSGLERYRRTQAFDGDPQHQCMGRSAPARLQRALEHAERLSIETPMLNAIAKEHATTA